jgi:hypothetical protein
MNLRRRLWGHATEGATTPVYVPLLALVPIVCSFMVTTWFFPRESGYLLTAAALVVVAAYGLSSPDVRLQFDLAFLTLLGGYWLGLLAAYHYTPHTEVLQYVLVTPLAVFATVIVLPALIDGRRQTFTKGLTLLAVALAVIGFAMLWHETQTPEQLYPHVGMDALGIDGIRTVSIFHNPNTYSFVMMVGSLTALYTYLARRGAIWVGALILCLIGLVLGDGDASLVGFIAGAVLVLSGADRRLGFLGIALAILGVYVAIRLGHVTDVMDSTLMTRVDSWVASLERLAQDPLFGIGFENTAERIGEPHGPHNSYIYPLLSTGLLAGGLYLSALAYAFGQGIRTRWTPWNAYVVGLSVAIFCYMGFESLFLGGLSISSIMLGLCLGLLLYSPKEESAPVTDFRSKFVIR